MAQRFTKQIIEKVYTSTSTGANSAAGLAHRLAQVGGGAKQVRGERRTKAKESGRGAARRGGTERRVEDGGHTSVRERERQGDGRSKCASAGGTERMPRVRSKGEQGRDIDL